MSKVRLTPKVKRLRSPSSAGQMAGPTDGGQTRGNICMRTQQAVITCPCPENETEVVPVESVPLCHLDNHSLKAQSSRERRERKEKLGVGEK